MIRLIDIDENVVYMEVTTAAGSEEMTRTYERIEDLMGSYDTVHVYEEVSLTGTDFLSMHSKASQDVRRGENVDLGRVAVVGGGTGMRALTLVWKAVSPLVSLSPDELRYFESSRATEADDWVTSAV